MTEVPQAPPCAGGSDRDEKRLVISAVRLLMRMPRTARYGLIAVALTGGAELSGGLDAVLDLILSPAPVVVREPSRAERPDLRLERADAEAIGR